MFRRETKTPGRVAVAGAPELSRSKESRWASDCETRPAEAPEGPLQHRLKFALAQPDLSCTEWTPDHQSYGSVSGTPTLIRQSLNERGPAQILFGYSSDPTEESRGHSLPAFEIPDPAKFVVFRRLES